MILETIAQANRERYEKIKKAVPLEVVKAQAEKLDSNTGFPFEKALKKQGLSYISEVKKASPSRGVIAED